MILSKNFVSSALASSAVPKNQNVLGNVDGIFFRELLRKPLTIDDVEISMEGLLPDIKKMQKNPSFAQGVEDGMASMPK